MEYIRDSNMEMYTVGFADGIEWSEDVGSLSNCRQTCQTCNLIMTGKVTKRWQLTCHHSIHVGPWMVRQYVPPSLEDLVPPGFFTFKFEPHPEDMGDRKTVEQQVQDPRTIEYTDKNQVWKHLWNTS